jgi:hypothetical protein
VGHHGGSNSEIRFAGLITSHCQAAYQTSFDAPRALAIIATFPVGLLASASCVHSAGLGRKVILA